ncbi:MAG: LytR/AlgR family response regulator transcription factor [Marinifilaceae bacterium]
MNNKLRTLIIEDEENDQKIIEQILQNYYSDRVELLGLADDVDSGIQMIQSQKPDLVLLDIVLHGNPYGAFEILDQVDRSFQIVFITGQNSSEYYIKALRLNCIDYISKPTTIEDFDLPLEKALAEKMKQKEDLKLHQYVERLELLLEMMKPQNTTSSIALPIEYGHIIVNLEDIILCQSAGNYTEFWFYDQTKRLVSGNLKHFEELFSDFSLVRIHKQTMINLKHIKEYSRKEGGKVLLSNDETVYIGERWKSNFIEKYRQYVSTSMIHF